MVATIYVKLSLMLNRNRIEVTKTYNRRDDTCWNSIFQEIYI